MKVNLWDYNDKDGCPLCAEKEEHYYVLRCNSITTNNTWDNTIQGLEATLANNHTPSETIQVIAGHLYVWRNTTNVVP